MSTSGNPFRPELWDEVDGFEFTDITYHRAKDVPAVRIGFDRPEVRNAFRPHTVDELYRALEHARTSSDVGCVLLTGNGPSPKDGGWAFCSGGDQRIRGRDGYRYEVDGADDEAGREQRREQIDPARAGRLHILEVQRLIRTMPKVVVCVVSGWTAGGGHSLNVVCDLSIASRQHAHREADECQRHGQLKGESADYAYPQEIEQCQPPGDAGIDLVGAAPGHLVAAYQHLSFPPPVVLQSPPDRVRLRSADRARCRRWGCR